MGDQVLTDYNSTHNLSPHAHTFAFELQQNDDSDGDPDIALDNDGSDDDGSVVQITSEDPKAGARAAAILKAVRELSFSTSLRANILFNYSTTMIGFHGFRKEKSSLTF
jgi:hypothetical protein